MRRIFILLLCCLCLVTSVGAVSGIPSAQSRTVVSADGTCHVSLNVTLRLDTAVSKLTFPLPGQAKDISLNGSFVSAKRSSGVRNVDLSKIVSAPGLYTLSFQYSMPDAVTIDKHGALTFTLELLSGFAYPVESFDFSVALPGQVDSYPTFTSTYHQEGIDTMIALSVVDGNTLHGRIQGGLKDSEKLIMYLPVSEAMFPQSAAKIWSLDTLDLLMLLFAVLAIGYWLLSMRSLPPKAVRTTITPGGFNPGELGCQLCCAYVDFSMMVVGWAQMGYLLIQINPDGRILLHKRMDMGNERSDFEMQYFRKLFGKRQTVDGTGAHYARLCRKANACCPGVGSNFHRRSGNANIFRILCAVIGALSGIAYATTFVGDTVYQVLLSILLGITGLIVAWKLQSGAKCIHIRSKQPLWLGLACGGFWLVLGLSCGRWLLAVVVILAQFAAGLAAGYTGRRNEMGKQTQTDILGLRRYLRTVPQSALQNTLHTNPDFFYQIIPWALALDVDQPFAEHFGKARLPQCSYLVKKSAGHVTAAGWAKLLRSTVNALDRRQRFLPLERLLGRQM